MLTSKLLNSLLALAMFLLQRPILQESCTPQEGEQAKRYLSLADTYEYQKEWQKAADYYEKVALSPCSDLAKDGIDGLNRTLAQKKSWLNQYERDLQNLSHSLGIVGIQIAGLAVLAALVLRIILWRIDQSEKWIILPIEDYSGEQGPNRGEVLAETIASTIHDVRLLHSEGAPGFMAPSENVDMPTCSSLSFRQNLLSTLTELNALDVSGIGLPIGSFMSSLVRWLDLGRPRLLGYVRTNGDRLEITLRKEVGRAGRCTHIWRASEKKKENESRSDHIDRLLNLLCFRVLLDAAPGNWGTNSPEALAHFTGGLRHLRDFFESHSLDQGALGEARREFSGSIQIDPNYLLARFNLALVELNIGNYKLAVDHLKALLGRAGNPYLAEISYHMGIAYYHMTRDWAYDQAAEAFNSVLEYCGREPEGDRYREIQSLTYCGLIAVSAQKARLGVPDREAVHREILDHYQKALGLASGNPIIESQARYSLALWYLNLKEFEKVAALLQETLSLNPYHWRAYTAMGRLALSQGRFEAAIDALTRALDFAPRYEYAHYLLGRAYTFTNRLDEAIQEFSRAPGNARAHVEWGRILAQQKKYPEAIQQFEHAIRINPDASDAHADLAWYLAEDGFLTGTAARAEQAAVKALELSKDTPGHWRKLAVLGHVYYHSGRMEDAKRKLDEAILENPQAAQVYYYLAQIDLAEGNPVGAREKLVQIFRLEEAGLWHTKALDLMEKAKDEMQTKSS